MRKFDCYLPIKLSKEINSRLNELCGQAGQDRSKIARLALLDILDGTNHYRKEILRSIAQNARTGHGIIIQEYK